MSEHIKGVRIEIRVGDAEWTETGYCMFTGDVLQTSRMIPKVKIDDFNGQPEDLLAAEIHDMVATEIEYIRKRRLARADKEEKDKQQG